MPRPTSNRNYAPAGYDVERDQVVSWPGPTSLLVARVAEAVGLDARSRKVRRRLRNVITAVRLATGASLSPLVTIDGEPGNVRTMHPHIQPHAPRSMRLAHRPVLLEDGSRRWPGGALQPTGRVAGRRRP